MRTGIIFYVATIFISLVLGDDGEDKSQTLHKKMIARRREEHFILMKNLARNRDFESRFQLLRVAVDKIYEVIHFNRAIMENADGKIDLSEAKLTIIENTCLLMDVIVNYSFDNIIYAVFKKAKNKHWLGDFIWCMKFTEQHIDLLDELSTKEFHFVKENMSKIMNDEPLPEYPYENNVKEFFPKPEQMNKKKEKRRIKNRPHLTDPIKLEL